MMRGRSVSAFILLLCASLCAPAYATYTGLIVIPTASVVGDGESSIDVETDREPSGLSIYLINTEFGYANRFEGGIDYQWLVDGYDSPLFNGKYLPVVWDKGAFAVGVYTNGVHTSSSPYAVVSHNFGPCGLHFGEIRTFGHNQWFTGIDRALNDRVILMADYTSGSENFSSLGIDYSFSDNLTLSVGAIFPNDPSESTGFSLSLSFGSSYRKTERDNQ